MGAKKNRWSRVAYQLGKVGRAIMKKSARRLRSNTKDQPFCLSSTFLEGAGMGWEPLFLVLKENYSRGLVTHKEAEVTEVLLVGEEEDLN